MRTSKYSVRGKRQVSGCIDRCQGPSPADTRWWWPWQLSPANASCSANDSLVAMRPPAQLWKSFMITPSDQNKEIKMETACSQFNCRGWNAAARWKKKEKEKYGVDAGLYTRFPGSRTNVNVCVSSTNCSRFWKMFGLARISVPSNILFASLWHFTAVKSAVR